MSIGWSEPADLEALVRRRWDDGSLLRKHAKGEPFPTFELAIRGPDPAESAARSDDVRTWVHRWDAGSSHEEHYVLVGDHTAPQRAVVNTYAQAWALLGVERRVESFQRILAAVRRTTTGARIQDWVLERPHRTLDLDLEFDQILAAYTWFETNRGSGRYLRQIDAPGVDPAFAERHRKTLASMLGVGAAAHAFVKQLGLGTKPDFVRLRLSPGTGLPTALSEVWVRSEELAALPLEPATVLVCENETSFLSVPVPHDGAVIWARGFQVERVGLVPWLVDVPVTYWGNLDTHGFAALSRLRAWLPQARSVLMDRPTLLAHRDRWSIEPNPTRAPLPRLDTDEQELYADLAGDRYGDRVRLEQGRIDWAVVEDQLRGS